HQGKEVERRLLQNRRNLIYTNQWASGTYQLTFTTASTTRTTRLVIP
ncbi:MAG: T9SS type A sorting domain-containing protein, partial [Flavobacteriales bacterium]|nr:T9SS type A sorting domain-containing protein [Flavobacteriales bacterium]